MPLLPQHRHHHAVRSVLLLLPSAGNAELLYHGIHSKLFTLPDNTLVYPGHDYKVTTAAAAAAGSADAYDAVCSMLAIA
jgi:glyoxylase-like metal-dependent hydrolase (beta-lactamase superfamily II)